LWGQTVDEFTERVVRPYLRHRGEDDTITLHEFIGATFASEDDDEGAGVATANSIIRNLAATLERGSFVLVVAAPQVPAGVERALEYLNAQGLKLYTLEVDYFRRQLENGQVECFVPRLSVRPSVATSPRTSAAVPLERDDFLRALNEDVSPVIAAALDAVEEAGARVGWNSFGATIKVALENTRQVGLVDKKGLAITTVPPKGFPPAPFDRARERLSTIEAGVAGWDGKFHRFAFTELTPEQLQRATDALVDLCRELAEQVTWKELPVPHEERFTRNDYNLWLRAAPGLEPYRAQFLRGVIARLPDGDELPIQFAPLASDQPGWKPQLVDPAGAWPIGDNTGQYRIVVTAIGAAG
jgi:hypothetical protein